jgi:hypothetical protein
MRLIDRRGVAPAAKPNAALVGLVARAHLWWHELRESALDISQLAARDKVQASYLTRVLRLAFLCRPT